MELTAARGRSARKNIVLFAGLVPFETVATYSPTLDYETPYSWRIDENYGDGTMVAGDIWSFTTKPATLIVTDDDGLTGSDQVTITVRSPTTANDPSTNVPR